MALLVRLWLGTEIKVSIDRKTISCYMCLIQLLGNTMPIFSMLTPAPVLSLKQGGFRANNSHVSAHINWIPVSFVELNEKNIEWLKRFSH